MAENPFLLRDNLSDTGQIPSPASAFESPDLIVHSQVADPTASFGTADSWAKDLCQPLDIASQANLIYVRVKNTGTVVAMAYVRLYSCRGSLFLLPELWAERRLLTPDGSPVVAIGPIPAGGIGVASKPFVFNAQNGEDYCHVGVASTDRAELQFPASFTGFSEYADWLHKNPNIGMRNFKLVKQSNNYAETVGSFSNPLDHKVSATFTARLIKTFPVGTTVVVRCEQLLFNSSFTVTAQGETTFAIEKELLAYAEGIATASVFLPRGATAPVGGGLSLSFAVLRASISGRSVLEEEQTYTKVGECTTGFY